jgi:hypothetical protein
MKLIKLGVGSWLIRDKHSSLFESRVNDKEEESIIRLIPGSNFIKRFTNVTYKFL